MVSNKYMMQQLLKKNYDTLKSIKTDKTPGKDELSKK